MESSTEIFEVTILETKKISFYNTQGFYPEGCNFGDTKGCNPLIGETVAKISLSDYYLILEKSKKMLKRVKELSPEYWVHIIPYYDGESFVPIVKSGKYTAIYFNGNLVLHHPSIARGVNTPLVGDINILETDIYLGKTIARISEDEFTELKKMTNFEIGCISRFRPRSASRNETEFWIPVISSTNNYSCGCYKFKLFNNQVLLEDIVSRVKSEEVGDHKVVSEETSSCAHLFRCNVDLKILFCEKCGAVKWLSKY